MIQTNFSIIMSLQSFNLANSYSTFSRVSYLWKLGCSALLLELFKLFVRFTAIQPDSVFGSCDLRVQQNDSD